MLESKTNIRERNVRADGYILEFTNELYKEYSIEYEFINGILTFIQPDGETYKYMKIKPFLNTEEVINYIRKDKTINLLIDVFLVKSNPNTYEIDNFVVTERFLLKREMCMN